MPDWGGGEKDCTFPGKQTGMASAGRLIRLLWQHRVELMDAKENLCIGVAVTVFSEDSCVRDSDMWRDMNCHRSNQILFWAVGCPRIICSQIGV